MTSRIGSEVKVTAYRRAPPRGMRSAMYKRGLRLGDVISATRYALWCLVLTVVDLWYLNPVYLIQRRWRQLHPLNTRMALSVRPRLIDLATDFFLTDDRRKRQLLSWVQCMLPWIGDEDLFDFTASWQDGIVLCALVETLSPGACPRFNLLKPHHRVNNCRLGITLAQKYLQVAQVPLSPEEMAIADEGCEVKICHLVQLLKWKYQKQGSEPTPFSSGGVEEPEPCKCYARGTGLRAGIVGRRTKFNILTDAVTRLSLQIEIMGPNNEYNKEKIVSMYAGSTSRYGGHVITTSASAMLEDDGKTKVIEDGAGHSFIRQRSLDEDMGNLVIPLDYQCVGEGRFLVSYIPRSAGTHHITVLQQGEHVQGSPFEVKVSDWVSSWNLVPQSRVVPFDMLQTIEETPKDSLNPSSAARTERIRKKLSQVAHVSKQLTMMKRRVLKKVITRRGEEIICDVTPSPTLSRQSSVDYSDVSDEEKRKGGSLSMPKTASQNAKKAPKLGDTLSISHSENKTTPKKSPRKSGKNKSTKEKTASDRGGHAETASKKGDKQSKTGETASSADFANVVSLAMKSASGGKALDKTKGKETELVSCPITLQITQYETESDGNTSDARPNRNTPEQESKLKDITSNTQNINLEKVKYDIAKVSEQLSSRSSTKYDPRALCSKKPPSLTSTKSTSSSLSSIDKMSYVEVPPRSNNVSKESKTSLGGSFTGDRNIINSKDNTLPLGENNTKFTASKIVGTFLDTLSRGSKSPGLQKSGSLPLPLSKSAHFTDIASGPDQLDVQPPDNEGESTISQLARLRERTISLSSQSSSSSYPTRAPSQNVSPSPSRNVSPPTRNVSPSRSRNTSPSHSKNTSLLFTDSLPPPSEIPSLSRNSPAGAFSTKTNESLNLTKSITAQTENISESSSPSANFSHSSPKKLSPLKWKENQLSSSKEIPAAGLVENVNVYGGEKVETSRKFNTLSDGSDNPTISPSEFFFSRSETDVNEINSQYISQEPSLDSRSLPDKSSHFRTALEDLSKVGETTPSRFSENNESKSHKENKFYSPNKDGETNSHTEKDCLNNSHEYEGNEGINSNRSIKSDTTDSKLIKVDEISEHLQDEGIGVSSSSNTDEQTEQSPENSESKGIQSVNHEISMEEHKKRNIVYVADKDEQDLIDGNLDFEILARRRGSVSFDFSDYKPRHKITWSQHRSFSQERKLRKSVSCPSHTMARFAALTKEQIKSPLNRIRKELDPHLADYSSTSESGEEASASRGHVDKESKARRFHATNATEPNARFENRNIFKTNSDLDTLSWKQQSKAKLESDKIFSGFENALESVEKSVDSGHENEAKEDELKKRKDKKTTKYHIQLISANEMKNQDSRKASLTHTWSSTRGSSRGSFGKFRKKSRRLNPLSVSEARISQHPYFFSLGDDPGSDIHSDDIFSRGKTDQMFLTGSSSPTSSCASASTFAGNKTANSRTTTTLRRGRLARSKKWNTFDGDSIGGHQTSMSFTGGNVSMDQTIENGNSSGSCSDNHPGTKDDLEKGYSVQMRHLMNNLTRRRASEGIGLKAERDHEDEEGDEEDDEVLQIVIESKVFKNSNSPRRSNDDEFGNDDDEESILPQSLTSGPTGDHSSLTHFESNVPTSVENSPVSHLGAPAIFSNDSTNVISPLCVPNVPDLLGFPGDSVSPMSGLTNRSDNSDWSEDELLVVQKQPRPDSLLKHRRKSQEDKVRGDWSPRLVDFSCQSENLLSQDKLACNEEQLVDPTTENTNVSVSTIPPKLEEQINIQGKLSHGEKTDENCILCPNSVQSELASNLESRPSKHKVSISNAPFDPQQDLINCHAKTRQQNGSFLAEKSSHLESKADKSFELRAKGVRSENNREDDECCNSPTFQYRDGKHTSGALSRNNKSAFKATHCSTCLGKRGEIDLDMHSPRKAKDPCNDLKIMKSNFQSSPSPSEMIRTSENFMKKSDQQGIMYWKMRKLPRYEYQENKDVVDSNDSLALKPYKDTKHKDTMPLSCNQCLSCAEVSLKRKSDTPETIRPIHLNFGSPMTSAFFSNIDMLSPSASVCATTDIWSTPSKSYTGDENDLQRGDVLDYCSSCSICEEMKETGRVPDGCEVNTEPVSYYFQEKTLTPTKYRQLNKVFADLKDNLSFNTVKKNSTDWATRLNKQKAGFYPSSDDIFCFNCAKKVQDFSEKGSSFATHPFSEPGDLLLTPTKFKRGRGRYSDHNVGAGRIERNSQTYDAYPFHSTSLCSDRNSADSNCAEEKPLCNVPFEIRRRFPKSQGNQEISHRSRPIQASQMVSSDKRCHSCSATVNLSESSRDLSPSARHQTLLGHDFHSGYQEHIQNGHNHQGHFQNSLFLQDSQNIYTESFRSPHKVNVRGDDSNNIRCTCQPTPKHALSPAQQQSKKSRLSYEKGQQSPISAVSQFQVNGETGTNHVPNHSLNQHYPQQRKASKHCVEYSLEEPMHSETRKMDSKAQTQLSSSRNPGRQEIRKEKREDQEQIEFQDNEKQVACQHKKHQDSEQILHQGHEERQDDQSISLRKHDVSVLQDIQSLTASTYHEHEVKQKHGKQLVDPTKKIQHPMLSGDGRLDQPYSNQSPPDYQSYTNKSPPDYQPYSYKSPPDYQPYFNKSPPDHQPYSNKSPPDYELYSNKSPPNYHHHRSPYNHQPHRQPHHHHQQPQHRQNLQHQELQHYSSSRINNGARRVNMLKRESTVDTFDSGITEGSLHAVLPPQATRDSHTLEDPLRSLDLSGDLENLEIDQPLNIPQP